MHAWVQPDWTWGLANAGLVVGDGEACVVDTLFDVPGARRMADAMQAVLDGARVTTVVNTHSDGDHWWGNELFPDAEVITTERSAALMGSPKEVVAFKRLSAALRVAPLPRARRLGRYVGGMLGPYDFASVNPRRPDRTFSGEREIEVGGRKLELIEVGPAHTAGDSIVWVPDARVVLAADVVFLEATPVIWAGPVSNWLAALDRIEALGPERIVPGHGPVCGVGDLSRVRGYWEWLEQAYAPHLAAERPPLDAAKAIMRDDLPGTEWASWGNPERLVMNLHVMQRHAKGEPERSGPRFLIGLFSEVAELAESRR